MASKNPARCFLVYLTTFFQPQTQQKNVCGWRMQTDATLSWFKALLKNSPKGAEEKYEEPSVRSPGPESNPGLLAYEVQPSVKIVAASHESSSVVPAQERAKKKKARAASLRKKECRHDKRRLKSKLVWCNFGIIFTQLSVHGLDRISTSRCSCVRCCSREHPVTSYRSMFQGCPDVTYAPSTLREYVISTLRTQL